MLLKNINTRKSPVNHFKMYLKWYNFMNAKQNNTIDYKKHFTQHDREQWIQSRSSSTQQLCNLLIWLIVTNYFPSPKLSLDQVVCVRVIEYLNCIKNLTIFSTSQLSLYMAQSYTYWRVTGNISVDSNCFLIEIKIHLPSVNWNWASNIFIKKNIIRRFQENIHK